MLCADFLNTLYKLKINRTFIEHKKNSSIKKSKKCTYINMEVEKKIDPLGFREYDARWLYPKSINAKGIEAVGKGFGTQVIISKKNELIDINNGYTSTELVDHKVKGFPITRSDKSYEIKIPDKV